MKVLLASPIGILVMVLFLATLAFAAEPAQQASQPKPSEYEIGVEVGAIVTQMRALEAQYKQLEAAKAQLEAMRDKKPEAPPTKGAKQ